MPRRYFLPALALTVLAGLPALAQTALKDPQGVVLTTKAVSALNGTTSITDVTVQATANYIAGSDEETGTATLLAKAGESRITLTLTGGQRAEVRNNSGGIPQGSWSGPDGVWHAMALHNCWTDTGWFFPALSFEAALNDPQVAIVYVGLESREGLSVQHVQFSRLVPGQSPNATALIQQLSTTDVYLDAVSYLPVAIDFSVHPDNNAGLNLPVEIQFSGYKLANGIRTPSRIQKLLQGSLMLELSVTAVAINSGLSDAQFAVL
jgi:hypothetical protein